MLVNTVKQMDGSFEAVLDNTINNLTEKITEMKNLTQSRVNNSRLSWTLI